MIIEKVKENILGIVLLSVASVYSATGSKATMELIVTNMRGEIIAGDTLTLKGDRGTELDVVTGLNGVVRFELPRDEDYSFWINTLTGPRLCEACPRQMIPLGFPEEDMDVSYTLRYDNMSFKLEGVFFETSKAKLTKESFKALDVLVEAIKMNGTVKIELGGHTDSDGNNISNQKLSQARAESAMSYLIKQGVSEGQVTARGYGEARPVAPNNTKQGKAMNRRTEVRILSR